MYEVTTRVKTDTGSVLSRIADGDGVAVSCFVGVGSIAESYGGALPRLAAHLSLKLDLVCEAKFRVAVSPEGVSLSGSSLSCESTVVSSVADALVQMLEPGCPSPPPSWEEELARRTRLYERSLRDDAAFRKLSAGVVAICPSRFFSSGPGGRVVVDAMEDGATFGPIVMAVSSSDPDSFKMAEELIGNWPGAADNFGIPLARIVGSAGVASVSSGRTTLIMPGPARNSVEHRAFGVLGVYLSAVDCPLVLSLRKSGLAYRASVRQPPMLGSGIFALISDTAQRRVPEFLEVVTDQLQCVADNMMPQGAVTAAVDRLRRRIENALASQLGQCEDSVSAEIFDLAPDHQNHISSGLAEISEEQVRDAGRVLRKYLNEPVLEV